MIFNATFLKQSLCKVWLHAWNNIESPASSISYPSTILAETKLSISTNKNTFHVYLNKSNFRICPSFIFLTLLMCENSSEISVQCKPDEVRTTVRQFTAFLTILWMLRSSGLFHCTVLGLYRPVLSSVVYFCKFLHLALYVVLCSSIICHM